MPNKTNRLRKIRAKLLAIALSAFFAYYLILGLENLGNDQPIILFDIKGVSYEGASFSLVAFGGYWFILIFRFTTFRSLGMLMFTYGTWEFIPGIIYWRHTGIELLFVFFIVYGLWFAKPKLNLSETSILAFVLFCIALSLMKKIDWPTYSPIYTILWLSLVALVFRPREEVSIIG